MVANAEWGREWEEATGEEYTRSRYAGRMGIDLKLRRLTLVGGTTDSQREFLEALSTDNGMRTQDRQSSKHPPIANNFALGYTYQDVLDADHEGTEDSI